MKITSQGGASVLASRGHSSQSAARGDARPTKFILPFLASMIFLVAIGATAQTTNALSDKEIQGRQLAQKLLEQQPVENFTNTGVLEIRDAKKVRFGVPVVGKVLVTPTNWQSIYETSGIATLLVIHTSNQLNKYFYQTFSGDGPLPLSLFQSQSRSNGLASRDLSFPFAGSDFWICDLGLEFLHWPGQKILRGDTARGRLCKVLESTNPNPSTNGYSRVLCWIDNEALGIVKAEAYDAKGKLLKEFLPKDIKKVNGQWQVGSMKIDNVQTGSRTTLEFDLKAK
jgi:hypothetical protein